MAIAESVTTATVTNPFTTETVAGMPTTTTTTVGMVTATCVYPYYLPLWSMHPERSQCSGKIFAPLPSQDRLPIVYAVLQCCLLS